MTKHSNLFGITGQQPQDITDIRKHICVITFAKVVKYKILSFEKHIKKNDSCRRCKKDAP